MTSVDTFGVAEKAPEIRFTPIQAPASKAVELGVTDPKSSEDK